jgi:hypothetical protein
MDKTTRNLLIVAAILVIGGLIALFVAMSGNNSSINTAAVQNAVQCPADTFICPDGTTTVSRVAPGCQFAQCPNPTNASSSSAAVYKD